MTRPGWTQLERGLVVYVHEATGFEVTENLKGYRVFRPNGRSLPGTYNTVAAAMKAAERAVVVGP
jgi:hypothetical protein